jgi:hypothetical protein
VLQALGCRVTACNRRCPRRSVHGSAISLALGGGNLVAQIVLDLVAVLVGGTAPAAATPLAPTFGLTALEAPVMFARLAGAAMDQLQLSGERPS